MKYRQITSDERYTISSLRKQGYTPSAIARELNRSVSSITREVARNLTEGSYRAKYACEHARQRRRESRRKWHFSDDQWQMVIALIRLDWSPEQVSGWLKRNNIFLISHATIYRYIWYDKYYQGQLYKHLRQSGKRRRKHYGGADSRGVLAVKRHISERPLSAENKSRIGHWEIDTVMGGRDLNCIVTLVDRKTKYTVIGKLNCRTTAELNRRVIGLLSGRQLHAKTITADNGTEFHGYKEIERATGADFYFATPYHSWERGLNENTNGLIRQYLPKRISMEKITQEDCDVIAMKLNRRPRKCLHFKTPEQAHANYL